MLGAGVVTGAGAVGGSAMSDVIGSVTAEVDTATVIDVITFADEALETVSDDGTRFRAAAQLFQGEGFVAMIELANRSETTRTEMLTLDVPDGVTVDVVAGGTDGTEVGRVDVDKFLVKLVSGDNLIEIPVAIAANSGPGFYEIEAELRAFEEGL